MSLRKSYMCILFRICGKQITPILFANSNIMSIFANVDEKDLGYNEKPQNPVGTQ